MPSGTIYVTQDGADFYVYDSPACKSENLLMTRTYPDAVWLHDLDAAKKAREWFIQLCSANQRIEWPNPFAGA